MYWTAGAMSGPVLLDEFGGFRNCEVVMNCASDSVFGQRSTVSLEERAHPVVMNACAGESTGCAAPVTTWG